jgi:GNAT superfamily N-acetyltransferase
VNSTEDTPDEVVLRPADEHDLDAITEVYLSSRRAAEMPPPLHSDEDVREWLRRRLRGSDETWVATVDAQVVGYVRFTEEWLDDLYIAPSYAGRGIGSALLDLVKGLRPDGFGLWVFEMNRAARRFYASRGLVEVERTDGSDNEERCPDVRLCWKV